MKLEDLQKDIRKVLISKNKHAVITRSSVIKRIDMATASLKNFRLIGSSLSPEHDKIIWNFIETEGKQHPYAAIYAEFVHKLEGQAAQNERKSPMRTCDQVAGRFITTLDDITDKVPRMFDDKMNLNSMRFSHLAILGTVELCEQFAKTCVYLYQGIAHEIIQETPEPPRYRYKYVHDHLQTLVNVTNWVYRGNGPIAYEVALKELRNANNDILIADDNGDPNTKFFNMNKVSRNTSSFLGSAMQNPFFILGKLWVEWERRRISKLEQEREWIESNVALLKLKLENVDRDSPEYTKREKVVERYEGIISELDRKINKYYEDSEG